MIKFTAINVDGNEVNYEFESVEALEKELNLDSIDMGVPANDDEIIDFWVDGKQMFIDVVDKTYDRIGTDTVWFEDLLTYLGIEI